MLAVRWYVHYNLSRRGVPCDGKGIDGAGAALPGLGEPAGGAGVEEPSVEGTEGEQVRTAGHAGPEKVEQFTGEGRVPCAHRGEGDGVGGG